MGGTSEETSLETMETQLEPHADERRVAEFDAILERNVEKTAEAPPAPKLVEVPEYGPKEAREVMAKVRVAAENGSALTASFTPRDLLILNDILYEMDKHLPGFIDEE